MKTPLFHTQMAIMTKSLRQPEPQPPKDGPDHQNGATNTAQTTTGDATTDTTRGTSEKISISAQGMKRSQQQESPEDQLPPHIKRLKEQIKLIKLQIAEQEQKLAELEQSNINQEIKDATRELYLEQLASMQSTLTLTSIALEKAIKEEGITDPVVLMAALF